MVGGGATLEETRLKGTEPRSGPTSLREKRYKEQKGPMRVTVPILSHTWAFPPYPSGLHFIVLAPESSPSSLGEGGPHALFLASPTSVLSQVSRRAEETQGMQVTVLLSPWDHSRIEGGRKPYRL